MDMKLKTGIVFLAASILLSGCSQLGQISNDTFGGTHPGTGPVVPDGTLQLTTRNVYSLETLAVGAVAIGVIYLVYDPLAPNWKLEEKALNADTYYLSMQAKSFRTGGDGEAMMIMKRRALKLQRENGYTSYRILDYSEGIESSTPFTHRFSEGTIQLVRADAALPKP
jgi:hypothetical protein